MKVQLNNLISISIKRKVYEKRAKQGDVFSVQLPNGQYMFGKVLLDIKQQCFKSGIVEMATSQLRYGSISYLIEIYDCITDNENPPASFKVVIPGIVVDEDHLRTIPGK